MAPKIFITGAAGYIGGEVLIELLKAHPDLESEITALVRNSDRGAQVAAIWPKIKLVYGDLDSTALLEEEASKADIVYQCADSDHPAAAEAIGRGIANRQSSKPGFFIHTSGALVFGFQSMQEGYFGETRDKRYNDWDGVNELTTLPDDAYHRNVDKIVLAASKEHPDKVKTAIVCPPTIFGRGRGIKRRSIQVPNAAQAFLQMKQGFRVGKGENRWDEIHVTDLARLYVLLGEAAAAGGSPATWNEEGYYLTENGSYTWGNVMSALAKEAHKQGFLPSAEVKQLSVEEANAISTFVPLIFGTDVRGEAVRGKKLLGWQPREHGLMEEIPNIVSDEAKAMGLVKGHAEKVQQ